MKDKFKVAPWMVKIDPHSKNGLEKTSSLDCFQIRSLSEERFVKKIGNVSDLVLEEIQMALAKVLSIKYEIS